MGLGGVPARITEQDIHDAIVKHHGVMKRVAEECGVSHNTIYIHFNKYPNLKPLLDEHRMGRKERMLDTAEEVLDYAMSECKEKDINAALKACMFFLNNRGRERGYSPIPEQNKEQQKEAYNLVKNLAEAMTQSSSQAPSLDKEHKEDQS